MIGPHARQRAPGERGIGLRGKFRIRFQIPHNGPIGCNRKERYVQVLGVRLCSTEPGSPCATYSSRNAAIGSSRAKRAARE